jgi:hypothetical protein
MGIMSILTLFVKVFYKVMEMENKKHSLFLFDTIKIYDIQKIVQHHLITGELLFPFSLTLWVSLIPSFCTTCLPVCFRLFRSPVSKLCRFSFDFGARPRAYFNERQVVPLDIPSFEAQKPDFAMIPWIFLSS